MEYAHLAQVYDGFMYDISYSEWAAYIGQLLRENGAGNELLEYACGTGSLTLELCKAGYGMRAIDISEEMLDVAAAKLRQNAAVVQLACADMVDFVLNKPVDAAVCACDGVNYILEESRLFRFFQTVHKNLKQNGLFLFDISAEYKLAHILGDEFFYDDSDEGTLFWQNAYNAERRITTMDISLFVPKGEVYKRYDECHVQRAWQEKEIEDCLTKAGFERIQALDFPTGEIASDTSERIQFVARKGE